MKCQNIADSLNGNSPLVAMIPEVVFDVAYIKRYHERLRLHSNKKRKRNPLSDCPKKLLYTLSVYLMPLQSQREGIYLVNHVRQCVQNSLRAYHLRAERFLGGATGLQLAPGSVANKVINFLVAYSCLRLKIYSISWVGACTL